MSFIIDFQQFLDLAISFIALIISVFSLVQSSKANRKANILSAEGNKIALRQVRAAEHAEFVQILFKVNQRLEKVLYEIQDAAGKAYEGVADMLDDSEKQKQRNREPLGGRYFKLCNLVFAGLCYQLAWQSEVNLNWRLSSLWNNMGINARNIDIYKEYKGVLIEKFNWVMYYSPSFSRGIFFWRNPKPPINAEMLARGVMEMFERIDVTKKNFIEVYKCCLEYFKIFDKSKPIIDQSIKELEILLELNKHKEFKLYESYSLYKEYMETLTKLKFLRECGMQNVRLRYERSQDKYFYDRNYTDDLIGFLIYIGVILSSVWHYHMWGTDHIKVSKIFEKL